MATKRAASSTTRRRPAPRDSFGLGPDPATFPADAELPPDVVCYGPDIPDERTFRLLGSLGKLEGKRVLDLGAAAGHNAVTLARQGARVIAVDPSGARLERVRAAAEQAEVKLELRQAEPAEIAFVRAESIDAAISVFTLATVPDLDRVFRQVHRVLRREAPLIFSIPHPAFCLIDPTGLDLLKVSRSYFDRKPRPFENAEATGALYHRGVGELLTSLLRANFRIDTVLEPEPVADAVHSSFWTPAMELTPSTLLIRARKEGL
jgi:SAM-dependent methyltransferase